MDEVSKHSKSFGLAIPSQLRGVIYTNHQRCVLGYYCSVGVGVGWPASASNVPIRHLTMVGGICIPVLGMLIGLAGRPRLILAIVPASIGAVLFWVATTTP
jgi:hypothetical protein